MSLISAFRPVIISRIEQITSSFYESILRVDKLKEIITKHTTVERLRLTLSNHVIEMFSGKIDEAFIQKRLKIALVHQKIGLPPKWYMGAFQNLQSTLLRIAHDMQNELPHYDCFIQAITKLLSFEQQLVLEA
ncbi:protoglobin domain-containing protein [Brevibacillus panacihumi]|uniref:protoglobin domain-containing protein n=1 Tax=Brevibacillus panacihumi TaxID=497735 RepID=UPI003D22FE70